MKTFNKYFTVLVYLFLYVPMIVLAVASFNSGTDIAVWKGFTFAQYGELFRDGVLLPLLLNSVIVAVLSSLIATVLGTMAAMGIVNGYPDGSFRPNAPITRAEFAAIASRFDANASEEGDWFSDISGHWAEKAIIKAVNNGWIKGYDDGTFRPNNPITRGQMAKILYNLM